MGGLLFSLAFVVVVAVFAVRAVRGRWRQRRQLDHHVVARFDDVDALVRRVRCLCGRQPDRNGEGPRDHGGWGVELSCVCGRRRSMVFIVGN